MSGFEVVGVVLAVYPILTQAVGFCAEESGLVKDLFRYQHVLKRIGRGLAREQTSFSNSCRRFMEDIASQCEVEEEAIVEMMQDPTDDRWREGALIKEHIFQQKSVRQYLDTVEDMNEELGKIKDLITKYGDNDTPDKKSRRRQWKKLILVLNKDGITQHLEEAGRLNNFLARLTEQNQSIFATRRISRRNTKHYTRIRAHAIDLYETLQSKFPASPSCNCMLRHDVNMKLEFRNASISSKHIYFHTVFTFGTEYCSPWNWRELEMQPWETKIDHCQDDHHTRVKFNIDPPSASQTPTYQDINDLCAMIMGPMSSLDWLGAITSDKGRQHRIRAIDHQQRLPSFQSIETISLASVLQDKAFRQEQRSRLGLKLASSVMQLHSTEWLTDYWDKSDISFLRSSDATVDFDNPLIRRSFGPQGVDIATLSSSLPTLYLNSIPCLFSLGVVLMELWYRKVFADLKNETEKSMPPEFSDALAARRLASEMDCGPNYKNSVLRCVSGLDAVYTSLSEDKFRDEVEEKIISPLEDDLKFYCNKSSVEDCI
ncbi:Synaptobrevin [Penicillium verhagenii]|uniref:Synaptobrevin n=1 Tax=Penicillium verhagenii TaxID=1562060 RepID=UPI002545AF39|nr:Synaptobrevin [Penicillium verhagenii]KAJ5937074.1 Synaptobrevin [Penicillium verhagenii]